MPVLTLCVFLLAYVGFAVFSNRRSWTALTGAAVLILSGSLAASQNSSIGMKIAEGARTAFLGGAGDGPLVSWNVLGLFFGMLILAELFLESKVPAVIAEAMLSRLSSARAAILLFCAFAGVLSIAVENVAVVLLLAPIAIALAEKLGMRVAPILIGVAVCSNVQGTATMIGDPPSMILAGAMKMGFFDFFVYHGKLGIFFAVQAGAIASLLVLGVMFRKHAGAFRLEHTERARSWVPAVLLALLIAGLSLSSVVDPGFSWYAGTLTVGMGAVAFLWNAFKARWIPPVKLLKSLDWDTTFFLVGVFILVGGLSNSGWLERLSTGISSVVGGSLLLAFVVFVALATVISGFVDNVPFLLAMIPVVRRVAELLPEGAGAHPEEMLLFGLLVGACMGGNLTPIGASANVTTLGILRKRGETVGFREFSSISLPFTAAAVAASALFVWLVWR